jgi:hypothetical protein
VLEIGIVVPVMARPQNAAPFIRSLVAAGPTPAVYPVCDPDDHPTRDAWRAAGTEPLVSGRGHTFANKAQHAYLNTSEPWIMLVGDDVRFHSGWLEAATLAASPEVCLISTNDLGNPYVAAGTSAIHPIIRRTWVDDSGASWDGPGHITHEGYRHICDMEWSAKAINEGVFVYCPDAVVEHVHPVWSRAEWDRTYQTGMAANRADLALFAERSRR